MRILPRLLVLLALLGCLVYVASQGVQVAPAERQEPTLHATILMALILAVAVNSMQNYKRK